MLLQPLLLEDNFITHFATRSPCQVIVRMHYFSCKGSINKLCLDRLTVLTKIKMTHRDQETILGRGGCNNDCLLVLQWIRVGLSNASPSLMHRNSPCVGPFKILE